MFALKSPGFTGTLFFCTHAKSSFYICGNRASLRYLFSCFFYLVSYWLVAQHHYNFELRLMPDGKTIEGKADIWLVNHTLLEFEEIYVHLPSRALSWKGSFFHQQYLEFQKTDLHFASDEKGGIEITYLNTRNSGISKPLSIPLPACVECEFLSLPLANALKPGDSLKLAIDFKITLPSKDWLGSYFTESELVISDWLPEIAPLDALGFHQYPETWQRDRYCQASSYHVRWSLPDSLIVASNAQLITPFELQALGTQAAAPFSSRAPADSIKHIEFHHYGTSLQFIISSQFSLFSMTNGGMLYMQQKDPFLPSVLDTVNQRISKFIKSETGVVLGEKYDLVILDSYNGHGQSDKLITLAHPGTMFEFSRELASARFETGVRYKDQMNGYQDVWLARGIPYYYKYRYIQSQFPQEFWTPWQDIYTDQFWQPFAHSVSGWVLSLNKFDYAYQNQYLFLFLSRQGLDQPLTTPADSLTRLNYGAIPQAKSFLALNHLREYMGNRNFGRAMNRFLKDKENTNVPDLQASTTYFHNRDLTWFFDDWINSSEIYNYQMGKFEYCPTVATASIKNKGRLSLPYSVTGYKNGDAVITEWFDGHEEVENKQLYHEEYDMLRLNDHGQNAEWNLKDNYYHSGLFPHLKPIKIQFYQTFEDPRSTQIFWMPGLGYNAYDKVLLSLDLYNYGLVTRPWEWNLSPSLSTGQGQLTGSASLERNFIPKANSMFHRISAGLYMRYYHYDEDLAFFRLSPSVTFRFRKPYARSTILQRVRLRAVHLERELPPEFEGVANDISNSSYTVINLTHRYEETRLIKPYTIRTDLLVGNQFSRLDVSTDFRWMLPNRKWLIWRGFGGVFLNNKFADQGAQANYYSLGLSGTQDFMFDYYFIGRSDQTGIWSKQFFVTDGGFKTETDVYANQWMLATNLSLPVWQIFGLFGDIGLVDGLDQIQYDYGVRVSLLTDFLEIYFPLGYNSQFFPTEPNYGGNIRYVLNLDLDAILHRLRRGYY